MVKIANCRLPNEKPAGWNSGGVPTRCSLQSPIENRQSAIMSAANQAVFLSYASQDVVAALLLNPCVREYRDKSDVNPPLIRNRGIGMENISMCASLARLCCFSSKAFGNIGTNPMSIRR